jgi:hypothetical protein
MAKKLKPKKAGPQGQLIIKLRHSKTLVALLLAAEKISLCTPSGVPYFKNV